MATRRAPHQGQAWNGLGAMRLFAEDFLGAVGPLQQASTLLPNDPNPPMNLGLAFEGLRRWNEAVRAFREALHRDPNLAAARNLPSSSRPLSGARVPRGETGTLDRARPRARHPIAPLSLPG